MCILVLYFIFSCDMMPSAAKSELNIPFFVFAIFSVVKWFVFFLAVQILMWERELDFRVYDFCIQYTLTRHQGLYNNKVANKINTLSQSIKNSFKDKISLHWFHIQNQPNTRHSSPFLLTQVTLTFLNSILHIHVYTAHQIADAHSNLSKKQLAYITFVSSMFYTYLILNLEPHHPFQAKTDKKMTALNSRILINLTIAVEREKLYCDCVQIEKGLQ